MADWGDDDDFGGFESADTGNIQAVQDAASPTAMPQKEPGSGQVGILDWILSNTPKADSSGTEDTKSPLPTFSDAKLTPEDQDESAFSISHGEQLKDRLNDSAEIAKGLDDIFSGSEDAVTSGPKLDDPPRSEDFLEVQDTICAAADEEPSMERTVDNEALHRLRAELDAALLMKEQTEKSMQKLKDELEALNQKRKEDLEKSERLHEEELDKLKKQHKEEMEELQKVSEETAKLVARQYSDVWKMYERERSHEEESNINCVTEKCIELLKQRQDVLSKKLEDERVTQEKELKKVMDEERETMQSEFEEKLENAKEKLKQELTEQVKEKMTDEAKILRQVHTDTLKEATGRQQSHFEDLLRSTLETEREKFTETLKEAVKRAQDTTEKAAEERRKLHDKRTKSQMLAVKILLSSALEQFDRNFSEDETQHNEIQEES